VEIYLVGGAVRDRLLGLPVAERDYVVVGASPAQMIERGFKPVGRDFPVFLHPETKEEYALARSERKAGSGHGGFRFQTGLEVSLVADLARRDLTINAIAEGAGGELIDPYGGRADLESRLLRHVSPAFVEDPLRLLRVARFSARFHALGFRLAPETQTLMRAISHSGELATLPPERIWQETRRALATAHPEIYIQTLRDVDGLKSLFPEIDCLFGIPQDPREHPEIDAGEHVLQALAASAREGADPIVAYAVLVHDLGKGRTDPSLWPNHPGHAESGLEAVRQLNARLRVPHAFRLAAELATRWHLEIHRALDQDVGTLDGWLSHLPYRQNPALLDPVLAACAADFHGRTGHERDPYPPRPFLSHLLPALAGVRLEAGEYDWTPEQKRQVLASRRIALIRENLARGGWTDRPPPFPEGLPGP
jgi:tRNA nucleotidyltransferase (CCA-adding enzyme)